MLGKGACYITVSAGIDVDYIYYQLQSPHFKSYIISMSTGSTIKHISLKTMRNYSFPLPAMEVQKKISRVLSALDGKIELNQRINENLERQAQAIFTSWFVSFEPFGGICPTDWHLVTLDEITSLITRGITPKYDESSDQFVINQKCIRNHTIDMTPARKHRPKVISEKWLQYGDLLINSTGEGTLGRAAQVLFAPTNMTTDSHVTIIRPSSKELIYYIGLWGITHEREIESLHTGSTGQTELPRDRVRAMELLLPDKETLEKFNAVIYTLSNLIVYYQTESTKLESIRDALLPKLMSGEIDVSSIKA